MLDPVSQRLDDKLHCRECGQYFNANSKKPRFLRCMHSICEECGQRQLLQSSEITCRQCMWKTSILGTTVSSLPENEDMRDLALFLTPDEVPGNLETTNVPLLLKTARDEVQALKFVNRNYANTYFGGNTAPPPGSDFLVGGGGGGSSSVANGGARPRTTLLTYGDGPVTTGGSPGRGDQGSGFSTGHARVTRAPKREGSSAGDGRNVDGDYRLSSGCQSSRLDYPREGAGRNVGLESGTVTGQRLLGASATRPESQLPTPAYHANPAVRAADVMESRSGDPVPMEVDGSDYPSGSEGASSSRGHRGHTLSHGHRAGGSPDDSHTLGAQADVKAFKKEWGRGEDTQLPNSRRHNNLGDGTSGRPGLGGYEDGSRGQGNQQPYREDERADNGEAGRYEDSEPQHGRGRSGASGHSSRDTCRRHRERQDADADAETGGQRDPGDREDANFAVPCPIPRNRRAKDTDGYGDGSGSSPAGRREEVPGVTPQPRPRRQKSEDSGPKPTRSKNKESSTGCGVGSRRRGDRDGAESVSTWNNVSDVWDSNSDDTASDDNDGGSSGRGGDGVARGRRDGDGKPGGKPRRRQKSSSSLSRRRSKSARRGPAVLDLPVNPVIEKFATLTRLKTNELGENCAVCQEKITDPSSYDDDVSGLDTRAVVRLKCDHLLHHHCASAMAASQSDKSFFKCPSCNQVHGIRTGNQPAGGTMRIWLDRTATRFGRLSSYLPSDSLSGFPKTDTIEIAYDFPRGVQGPDHPSPGKEYSLLGFPRQAYLPMTKKGYEVLCMLKIAFDRRLIFTVGTSGTSNLSDSVIWAGIHHKTSRFGGAYSYPDPNYLDNVTQELAAVGVTPADIPPNPEHSLGIGFPGP